MASCAVDMMPLAWAASDLSQTWVTSDQWNAFLAWNLGVAALLFAGRHPLPSALKHGPGGHGGAGGCDAACRKCTAESWRR